MAGRGREGERRTAAEEHPTELRELLFRFCGRANWRTQIVSEKKHARRTRSEPDAPNHSFAGSYFDSIRLVARMSSQKVSLRVGKRLARAGEEDEKVVRALVVEDVPVRRQAARAVVSARSL